MRSILGAAFLVLVLARAPSANAACDLTVTSCAALRAAASNNLSTAMTICLSAGDYGSCTFSDIQRTQPARVVPVPGASVTMSPRVQNSSYISFDGIDGTLTFNDVLIGGNGDTASTCSTHIQLANLIMAPNQGGIFLDGHTCPATPQHNVVDHVTLRNCNQIGGEGIISMRDVHTVQVKHSLISGVGDRPGDGIQIFGSNPGGTAVMIGPGNIIENILQVNCGGTHCDSMQFYSPGNCNDITITGNWFRNNSTFILNESPCEVTFTHNIVQNYADFQAHCWGASRVEHNTFYNAGFRPNGITETVIVRDNIWHGSGGFDPTTSAGAGGGCPSGPCKGCTASFNLAPGCNDSYGSDCVSGVPTYIDATAPPSTWSDWQLAAGSLGSGSGSDGLDRGTNYFGDEDQPPTPTVPAPPTNLRVR